MTTDQNDAFRQKLADLDNLPDTSFALRSYLKSAIERDVVDVMNEIDLLARILSDHTPEKREP
jgi:hypothetical protein